MFISIRWKITALIAGVVVLVTGLDAWFVPERAARAASSALKERASAVAAMLADSVAPALDFEQLDAAQTALDVSRADSLVVWAAAYDRDGNKMAASGKGAPSRLPKAAGQGNAIVSHAPIKGHGTLAVALDSEGVNTQRAESSSAIALQGLVIGLIGVAIALVFGGRMGRTLSDMSRVAENIARGDISESIEFRASNDELGRMADAFSAMAERLRALMESARRVSEGDLSISVHEEGELYAAFGEMVSNLRELAHHVSSTSDSVAGAAAGLFSAVRQQEAVSTQQNSALEEIRLTLESLTSSAEQVSSDAGQVRTMADSSLESSQRIADHTRLVSTHSERIGEILQLIQDIADKSDLLALNAALEGTNAGEVGRGFSLVAAEMRRLSEHVMDSVRDIRKLVADTREASHASVLATEEGIKLARDTAGSAAKISEAVSRQREGTQQVRDSADEIVRVVSESIASSQDTTRAGEALLQLSQELKTAAQKFRVSS